VDSRSCSRRARSRRTRRNCCSAPWIAICCGGSPAGKVHATDATNASRTLLFNIHSGEWDDTLLNILRVPRAMLPEVTDSAAHFGDSAPDLLGGAIAVRGIAGDQQAATIGQAALRPA